MAATARIDPFREIAGPLIPRRVLAASTCRLCFLFATVSLVNATGRVRHFQVCAVTLSFRMISSYLEDITVEFSEDAIAIRTLVVGNEWTFTLRDSD